MHPVNFFVIFFIIECASFPSSFRKRCVFVLNLSCQLFATLWSRLLCLPDFPSNNTGLCYHFLLQRICPTQGLNLYLIHWQAECLPRNHLGSQQADGGGGGLVAQSQPTLQPHGLWLARLHCPWDFPDKNTGVGCHSFSRAKNR